MTDKFWTVLNLEPHSCHQESDILLFRHCSVRHTTDQAARSIATASHGKFTVLARHNQPTLKLHWSVSGDNSWWFSRPWGAQLSTAGRKSFVSIVSDTSSTGRITRGHGQKQDSHWVEQLNSSRPFFVFHPMPGAMFNMLVIPPLPLKHGYTQPRVLQIKHCQPLSDIFWCRAGEGDIIIYWITVNYLSWIEDVRGYLSQCVLVPRWPGLFFHFFPAISLSSVGSR